MCFFPAVVAPSSVSSLALPGRLTSRCWFFITRVCRGRGRTCLPSPPSPPLFGSCRFSVGSFLSLHPASLPRLAAFRFPILGQRVVWLLRGVRFFILRCGRPPHYSAPELGLSPPVLTAHFWSVVPYPPIPASFGGVSISLPGASSPPFLLFLLPPLAAPLSFWAQASWCCMSL